MTTYFVSRHDGALRWARILQKQGAMPLDIDHHVSHLDATQLRKGDVVIGTLPVREIQRLREAGVRFLNLDLQVPPEFRGQELTATQMAACGATLTEYRVTVKESYLIEARRKARTRRPARPEPGVTLMLVSQELMPQYLGYLHDLTPEVILLVTKTMTSRAKDLKALLSQAPAAPSKVLQLPLDEAGGYAALSEQAASLFDELLTQQRERIVLNLTGGTKLMSLAFGDEARKALREQPTLGLVYVDTAQGRIESLGTVASKPMQALLGVADAVLASGKADAGCASASPLFQAQMHRQPLHTHLLANAHLIGLVNGLCAEAETLRLSKRLDKSLHIATADTDLKRGSVRLLAHSPLFKPLQDKLGRLLHEGGVIRTLPQREGDLLTLKITRPSEWGYLQGGWLEAEVARRIAAAEPDDWACGVVVGKEKGKNNEIDAIVTAGNRTLLIEIKTANLARVQPQDDGSSSTKAQDTLYKLDSIGHDLARNFNANWLISARSLSQPDLERAKDKRIAVFCPEGQETSASALDRFDAALAEWIASSRQYAPGGVNLPTRPLGISSDWVKREKQDLQSVNSGPGNPSQPKL